MIDFESTFGTAPAPADGLVMPFNMCSVKGEAPQNTAETIRGNRNPAEPFEGNKNVSGDIVIPMDVTAMGKWLMAMFGSADSSTQDSEQTIDNAAAVDKGDETTVGIPVTGHGYQTGQTVTIADTSNYDGDYTVLAASSTDEVVITAAYAAETFAGTETIQAKTYTHVFTVGDTMPSFLLERKMTDGSSFNNYVRSLGCKVSSFSMDVGGDGELTANLGILGASETDETSAHDADPTTLSIARAQNFHAALEEGGASYAYAPSLSISLDFGLDADQYCIGDGGVRGDLPEGIIAVSGTLTALFRSTTLIAKALASTESSLKVTLTKDWRSIAFEFPELQYARTAPAINGPKGILLELPFQGYYDDGADASAVKITLVNDVAAYSLS
jgi:hypothetical protein